MALSVALHLGPFTDPTTTEQLLLPQGFWEEPGDKSRVVTLQSPLLKSFLKDEDASSPQEVGLGGSTQTHQALKFLKDPAYAFFPLRLPKPGSLVLPQIYPQSWFYVHFPWALNI